MPANKGLPLDIQIAFKNLLMACKEIESEYSNVVNATYDLVHFTIRFNDIQPNSNFFIEIGNPGKNEMKGQPEQFIVTFQRFPRNANKLERFATQVETKAMPQIVKDWISMVEHFNDFTLDSSQNVEKFYSDEFYMQMDSSEGDADKAPFDDIKQEKLVKLLQGIASQAEAIEEQTEEIKQIANESRVLSNSIQRLPKNKVLSRLSKIFGKIKMQSPDIAKWLLKEAGKEGFKFILKAGFETVQHGLHNLLN